METINERLAALPALLGYDSPAALAKRCGLDPNTLRKAMQGPSKPSFDLLEALTSHHPKLNTEWLLLGKGTAMADGRALTPATASEPAADFTSGAGTIDATVNLLLKEQLKEARERATADRATIAWLQAELGKSPGSSDAVGHLHTPAPAPLPTVGFRLSVQRRASQHGMQLSR